MNLYILIPVYNDWESLAQLLQQIYKITAAQPKIKVNFLIVDDCSYLPIPKNLQTDFEDLNVLRLKMNVGHQKAIALGLNWINDHGLADAIIVMDADGEDRPDDIPKLLEAFSKTPEKIVFAKRNKRQEKFGFRILYVLYKFAFRLLTGKKISFGNFCLIPSSLLPRIVQIRELWLHFSGAIIKSKIPYQTIKADRGIRISGESTMSYTNLIMHGISSIAVHLNRVYVRMMGFSFVLMLLSILGILTVSGFRLFSNLAIPGWASTMVVGFSLLFLQAFFISIMLTFVVLYNRSRQTYLPANHYSEIIAKSNPSDGTN